MMVNKLIVGTEAIDFFNFDYDTIGNKLPLGISLSGGTDSAILLYLMAKYLNGVTIQPWTAFETSNNPEFENPVTIEAVEAVIEYVKNKFPEANILDGHKFYMDKDDYEVNAEALLVNIPGWEYYPMGHGGVVKILNMRKHVNHAFATGMFGLLCEGITMNPPQYVLDSWPKSVSYEPRRSVSDNINLECYAAPTKDLKDRAHYKPFINIDKKFIARLYEQEDVMDLYRLTESCVAQARATNWFTEPCRKCFWCYEKKWSFGSYDHGVE